MKLFNRLAVISVGLSVAIFLAVAAQTGAQAPATAEQIENGTAPAAQAGRGGRGGRGGPAGGRGPAYPMHPQADDATIARGQAIYGQDCATCHGMDARGGNGGINLVRSQLVMDDDKGELIAPVVQNGRPELGMPKFDLTADQVTDIAGYLHRVGANYRTIIDFPTNIVVGDASAGQTFFNGDGKCATCHSVTGDLTGIGAKMDAKSLQNALVSGGGGRGRGATGIEVPPTTVTVTLTGGKVVEGKLDHLDDFVVTLTDANDNHLTYERDKSVAKVVVHNPLQAHIDMLPKLTDDQIHNLTAYLVTLK
ncbi:MAG TPA: cytochrome c [Candidatus Acidoferrales bacterium]|nr:cytochrome c [Candidatus Acidoferrales bacterium]